MSREADQRLCFRYIASRIPLLHKYKISSLLPSSVAVQPGFCLTWSETPKTGYHIRTVYLGFDWFHMLHYLFGYNVVYFPKEIV